MASIFAAASTLWKSIFLSTFDVENNFLQKQGKTDFSPIHISY